MLDLIYLKWPTASSWGHNDGWDEQVPAFMWLTLQLWKWWEKCYEIGRGERKGALLFPSQQTFISSSANLSLLGGGGTHSCLSFPEQLYLSGNVVTPPRFGEGILIGETDSDNFILWQPIDLGKGMWYTFGQWDTGEVRWKWEAFLALFGFWRWVFIWGAGMQPYCPWWTLRGATYTGKNPVLASDAELLN